MSIKSLLFLIVVIGLSGCATTATDELSSNVDRSTNASMASANEESTEVTSASEKNDSDDPQQIVCKDTVVTGSNIPKIVCLTKHEWEKLERLSRQYTKDIQRRATHSGVN